MVVHLDRNAAEAARTACDRFIDAIRSSDSAARHGSLSEQADTFDTARQIGAVYSLFSNEDLRTLLDGFVTQVDAMSVLFSVAGGMIDSQDEAAAAALAKAAEEPAGLTSLGLMSMLASMHGPATMAVVSASASATEDPENVGGYDRVGPEDVSSTPLERLVTAAEALDPSQFEQVQNQVTAAADTLETAASTLQRELDDVLGGDWQGEFAQEGARAVHALTRSAFDLVSVLEEVASRADEAQVGFHTTRSNISSESLKLELAQARTPGLASGPGAALGPVSPGATEAASAARAAAEEQARAVVNTEYSPAVMRANLDDLQFPTAFQVVSGTALRDATSIDPVAAWNIGGVAQPAGAATPGPAALAAAGVGGPGPSGVSGVSGLGTDVAGPGAPIAATDAATEQALLASPAGGGDASGLGAGAANAGAGPAGPGPVNAATTAAGAPLAPVHGAPGQRAGAAGTGIGGVRGLAGTRSSTTGGRDRGVGSAAGLVGGGGATGAGAGAARMGGAGTLAGRGLSAGPGVGGPFSGVPGAGAGNVTGAPAGAGGTAPSSSTGGSTPGRSGAMPMGMMGAAGAGHDTRRRGHTPAGYLTNATNTTDIIGHPVKVTPPLIGNPPAPAPNTTPSDAGVSSEAPTPGRVLGRSFAGSGVRPPG